MVGTSVKVVPTKRSNSKAGGEGTLDLGLGIPPGAGRLTHERIGHPICLLFIAG